MKQTLEMVISYLLLFAGVLLILIGIPAILLPPPFAFGIILVAIGFTLTALSKPGQVFWRYTREHWAWLGYRVSGLHVWIDANIKKRLSESKNKQLDLYLRLLVIFQEVLNKTNPNRD
jgi:hypothetical protein